MKAMHPVSHMFRARCILTIRVACAFTSDSANCMHAECGIWEVQLLPLFHGYYEAARTSGLTPAARLSFAEAAAGPMSKLVLASVECTWHDRGALSGGAQTWRCHVCLN